MIKELNVDKWVGKKKPKKIHGFIFFQIKKDGSEGKPVGWCTLEEFVEKSEFHNEGECCSWRHFIYSCDTYDIDIEKLHDINELNLKLLK